MTTTSTSQENAALDVQNIATEQDIVAVGAVAHVIRRAFHLFYPEETNSSTLLSDAEQQAIKKEEYDIRCDQNEADPVIPNEKTEREKEKNLYVSFGEEKIMRITQELEIEKKKASNLLFLLESRYQQAKAIDEQIEDELNNKGLVIKAQIPMGPTNLRLEQEELLPFGTFSQSLIHARTLINDVQEGRLERSGNGAAATKKKMEMIAVPPPNYLNTTHSYDIRKEATLASHYNTLEKSKKDETQEKDLDRKSHTSRNSTYVSDTNTMGAVEKRKNMEIIHRMQTKLDFVRNPRYALPEDTDESAIHKKVLHEFTAIPNPVQFTEYDTNGIYQQLVLIKNTSHLARRIRVLPPASIYFSIDKVIYPEASGLVAPGMDVQVRLRFAPDSRADYRDSMTVQHESTGGESKEFLLPILAHRNPPELTIPAVLRARNTLVGDRSITTITCLNKGGKGKFWVMSEKEWSQLEATMSLKANIEALNMGIERLSIGPFQLYPNEFELDLNDSMELTLTYVPSSVGEQREKVVMICDNCLVRTFQLLGRGCQVDVKISNVNDNCIETAVPNMGRVECLLFDSTLLQSRKNQKFILSNQTPMNLQYFWLIEGINDLSTTDNPFTITPTKGVLVQESSQTFVVQFAPNDARIYELKAVLYVDGVPQCSVPNPDQIEQLNNTFQRFREISIFNADEKVFNLQAFQSLSLSLKGVGSVPHLEAQPQVFSFNSSLNRGSCYQVRIQILNSNEAPVQFAWDCSNTRLLGEQRPNEALKSFSISMSPEAGEIPPNSAIAIDVTLTPLKVGNFSISIPCVCQGISSRQMLTNFLLEGSVSLCRVEFLQPEIDFGLVLVGSNTEFSLRFRNDSIAKSAFQFVHLEALETAMENSKFIGSSGKDLKRNNSKESVSSKHSSTSSASGTDGSSLNTSRAIFPKATLSFTPEKGILLPGEEQTVVVTCLAGQLPERFRGNISCQVAPEDLFSGEKSSINSVISARAEIQSPNVYLTPNRINLGTTYLGVSTKRIVEIINLSNLETSFKWVEVQGDSKAYSMEFFPKSGVLGSKKRVQVVLKYTPRLVGKVTALFACSVKGLLSPLGFELTTNQKGLVLAYEVIDNSSRIPKSPKEIAFLKGITSIEDIDVEPQNGSSIPKLVFGDDISLCERKKLKFVIRNFSGIEAVVDLDARKFPPAPIPASDLPNKISSTPLTSALSKRILPSPAWIKKSQPTQSKINSKSLLSNAHEKDNRYQSDQGAQYIRHNDEMIEDRYVLQYGHGVAFKIEPSHVRILPWEQAVISVTCFNNMPGIYSDDIISRAMGLPPVYLHTTATIKDTPLSIDKNCVGLYFGKNLNSTANVQPTLHFGQVCLRSKRMSRNINIRNMGSRAARLKWKLQDAQKENELVNVSFRVDFRGKVNCRITTRTDGDVIFPFDISPAEKLIPKYSTVPFTILYSPPEELSVSRVLLVADAHWQDEGNVDGQVSVSLSSSTTSLSPVYDHLAYSFSDQRTETAGNAILPTPAGQGLQAVRVANNMNGAGRVSPLSTTSSTPHETVSRKCLRMLLASEMIEPELYLDKSKSSDIGDVGSGVAHHLKFTTWSLFTKQPDHPFHRKELHFVNQFSTKLTFRLESSGPFMVYKADSLAPKHPLSSIDLPPAHRRFEGESFMFTLGPNQSVSIDLRFDPSMMSDTKPIINLGGLGKETSNIMTKSEINAQKLVMSTNGKLMIKFTNGSVQTIKIAADILRPMIAISPSQYFFGHVHLSQTRSIVLRIANPTVVDAAFTITHVPAPTPISRAHKQEAKLYAHLLDDPSAFKFSASSGLLKGPTLSLCSSGGVLPKKSSSSSDITIQQKLTHKPLELMLQFNPKERRRYHSRFRFVVANGNDFDIVVEGEGSLAEAEQNDQDTSLLKTKFLQHSNNIFTQTN
jgi:hypothetical protein